MKRAISSRMRSLSVLFGAAMLMTVPAFAEEGPMIDLSDYDFEVEYVGMGEGGSWIGTGINGQYGIRVEAVLCDYSYEGYQWVLGSTKEGANTVGRIDPLYINWGAPCLGSRSLYQSGYPLETGVKYYFDSFVGSNAEAEDWYLRVGKDPENMQELTLAVKDGTEGYTTYEGKDNGSQLFLGCSNEAMGLIGNNYFKGRIYSFKIWVNDELKRDYVPCRQKSDGAIGLFDRVKNGFYPSISKSPFVAPENPSEDPIQDAIDKGAGVILSEYPEDGEIADEGATFMHDGKIWFVKNGGYIFVETEGRLEQVIKEPVISGFDNSAEGEGFVLTVDSFEGFTYDLISADNVQFDGQATDESKDGTGEALTFETKPNGEKRFYKLSVSETK